MTWIAVATGGALGSVARHGVNILIGRIAHRPLPYATAAVNLAGCAVIGVLAGLIASDRLALSPAARTFVFVGVLGGFTTFSSFGLDTFTLAHEGGYAGAFWNVAVQVGLGLLAVALGFRAGAA
jgi:CrcB protein